MSHDAKLKSALDAWARWYSAKVGKIIDAYPSGNYGSLTMSGAEQDLFEALGCVVPSEPPPRK